MNIKKVTAVVAGAVLATALGLSFSACASSGSGLKSAEALTVADYAVDFSKHQNYKQHSYGEATFNLTYSAEKDQIRSTHNNYPLVYTDEGTSSSYHQYKVVNILNNKVIASHLTQIPSDITLAGNNNGLRVLRTAHDNGDGSYYYKFYAFDGTFLMESLSYTITANVQVFYLNGEKIDVLVLTSSYGEKNYYRQTKNAATGEISYDKVDYNLLSVTADNLQIGATYNPLWNKLYPANSEKPVSGEIAEYNVMRFGNEYTFYYGSVKRGTLDMTYGKPLTLMDKYFYYYTTTPVKPDAKSGYNLVITTDGVTYKYDYSLHRYDVILKKKTEVKCNAVLMDATAFYNYKGKSYDAAVTSGYVKENGVAVVNYDVELASTKEVAYVVNKDFKIAYDVSHLTEAGFDGNVYNLSGLGYLVGNIIVDDSLKVLTRADTTSIYEKEGLIKAYNPNGGYLLTDFSGKINFGTGFYSSETSGYGEFEFYDGIAFAYKSKDDGSREAVLIKGRGGQVTNLSTVVKSTSTALKEIVYAGKGVYIVKTTNYKYTDYNEPESYGYEVFTYGGKSLKSVRLTVNGYETDSFEFREVNGKLFIVETVNNNSKTTVNYYVVN